MANSKAAAREYGAEAEAAILYMKRTGICRE
jgi:hypothetical protein